MKTGTTRAGAKWLLALGPVLALLLLAYCFGGEVDHRVVDSETFLWRVPSGQPEQMWSQVGYDPALWDTFFESDAAGYPESCETPADKEWPRPKANAMCFSTGFAEKHVVEFCEARFVDANTIDLLLHHTCPGFLDRLRLQVRSGLFTSQYWTFYKYTEGKADFIWTTKRQQLTLAKKVYSKGDVIKGRIDFECLQEATNPQWVEKRGRYPITIEVYGVFKTIVE